MKSKVIFFSEFINKESVNELIEKVEETRTRGVIANIAEPSEHSQYDISGDVTVHFSSVGGEINQMERMLSYFNSLATPVKWLFNNQLSSCAFEFAVRVNGDKEVVQYTVATLHLYTADIDYRDIVINHQNRHIASNIGLTVERCKKFLFNLNLPKEAMLTIASGQDWTMYDEDLKKYIEGDGSVQKETS